MKPMLSSVAVWLLAASAIAAEAQLPVTVPPPVDWPDQVVRGEVATLAAPEDAERIAWHVLPEGTRWWYLDAERLLLVETLYADRLVVAMATSTADTLTNTQKAIEVNGDGPAPNPDPQPDPQPDPTPGKLHVLILLETEPGATPPAQRDVLTSGLILDYLEAHCEAEAKDLWAYRFLDDDADVANLPDDWRKVFGRAKDSADALPWIVIANDTGASFEGSLPADVDATLELLKKYGGE